MSREFVLLSRIAPTAAMWMETADRHLPGGSEAARWRGGLLQMRSPEGREILTAWEPRELRQHREADALAGCNTAAWPWWTDVSAPAEATPWESLLAADVAARCDGQLIERT